MKEQERERDPRRIVTGKVRLSYCHLFEPWSGDDKQEKRYSVALLIPKGDKETLRKIRMAIEAAKERGLDVWGGKMPPINSLKMPLRDGDEDRPEQQEYVGHYFINANSKQQPGIVDRQVQPILDQTEVYSGCYARVCITMYAFNFNGKKGIACGLNHVQKLADGEPFGGQISAEEVFDKLEEEENEYNFF